MRGPRSLPARRAGKVAKILLVGENNPYSDAPQHALLPWPKGAAGDRLRRILGYSTRRYLVEFDRVNLLPLGAKWSVSAARERTGRLDHERRVLLGLRVALAHKITFKPFRRRRVGGLDLLMLPHPSGRCRVWNDRRSVSKARRALRRFLDS